MAVLNRIRIARLALRENPGSAQTRMLASDVLDECEREINSLQLQREQTAEQLTRLSVTVAAGASGEYYRRRLG